MGAFLFFIKEPGTFLIEREAGTYLAEEITRPF